MVARKARRSRGQESVQGIGSWPESARGFCGSSPQNHRVTWLSYKTKTRGSTDRDGIRTRREALKLRDTRRDRRSWVGRTWTASKAWTPYEKDRYLTILPLRGGYLPLCSRGSLDIFPTRIDYMYIALGFWRIELATREEGSEWEPIKILLERDEFSKKMNLVGYAKSHAPHSTFYLPKPRNHWSATSLRKKHYQ
jgi:hypothetical protein